MTGVAVQITGLQPLVAQLNGPMFRDVNRELRAVSRLIALDLIPEVQAAVRRSGAAQAAAMADTVRAHSDRVPVIVIGKVNPRFSTRFTRKGPNSASKARRGSLAHGVVYGPAGGARSTPEAENYYRIPRDDTGGPVGGSLRHGPIFDKACDAYLKQWLATMQHHGFATSGADSVSWKG